jgi:hypothetical protein
MISTSEEILKSKAGVLAAYHLRVKQQQQFAILLKAAFGSYCSGVADNLCSWKNVICAKR